MTDPTTVPARQPMEDSAYEKSLKQRIADLELDAHTKDAFYGERIAELETELVRYRDGYKGSCYACEPVGEANQRLEDQLALERAENRRLREALEELAALEKSDLTGGEWKLKMHLALTQADKALTGGER